MIFVSRVLLGVPTPSCSMQVIGGSTLCRTLVGYPLTMWCGGVAWYGWIPLDPDWITFPGWGPGIGDTSNGATAQPNALRLNLNSDAVSRPSEKECTCYSTMF